MKSDPNLYYSASRKVYILCYVDDLMIYGDKKAVADVVESLQKELLLRVTGELSEGQDATFPGRRMLVGQLLWLCNLRMDIMCAVKELSRGLAAPTTDHWAKLIKRLLRCLSGAKGYVQEICSFHPVSFA